MFTDSIRNLALRERSINLSCFLALLSVVTVIVSETVRAADYKVRIVCQAWSEQDQRFLDRVVLLEQLPTDLADTGASQSASVDASTLIHSNHEEAATSNVPFRMRIYNDVSLTSNLRQLSDSDAGDIQGDNTVVRVSPSMGAADEEVVATLRSREASLDSRERKMDYVGTASRIGVRLAFRSNWANNTEKVMDIFLKSSKGVVDTKLGPPDAPEDGPYFCKDPSLISPLLESRSGCMAGSQPYTEYVDLAQDRVLIREMQKGLLLQGVDPGPIDGILGPRTFAALQAWSAERGQDVSDAIGRDALCAAIHGVVQQ